MSNDIRYGFDGRKNCAVRVPEDVTARDTTLYAGIYIVNMPKDYIVNEVTGEDILLDEQIYIVLGNE
jgi:hypothetical protein